MSWIGVAGVVATRPEKLLPHLPRIRRLRSHVEKMWQRAFPPPPLEQGNANGGVPSGCVTSYTILWQYLPHDKRALRDGSGVGETAATSASSLHCGAWQEF